MRKKKLLGSVLGALVLFTSRGWAQTPAPARVDKSAAPTAVSETQPTPNSATKALEKAGAQILRDRPWLGDLYSWNETFDLDRRQVAANQSGAYCIGNGRAFALVGLNNPLWTWSNLYGASYQEPDLGVLRMNVTRAGIEASVPKQQIGWVRRSGVVKVRAEGQGLVVESYDFAPVSPSDDNAWDNPAALVRMVHVVNTSDHPETDLDIELKLQPAWNVHLTEKVEGRDLVIDQRAARAKKRTVWRLGSFNNRNVRIWDNNLHYGVPALPPGGETWAAFFLLSANSTRENRSNMEDIRKSGCLSLLDATRDYYRAWFDKGTSFAGDPKTVDLFEIESMIFKCQQSQTGGFSPLIGYSYTWIRDNNGPIRWFLKTGHPQEARRAMDFFYGVGSTMGSLPNSIRVDYPLNYHLKDLSKIHVEHAETPNWIVLQYWWYYLTTGDIELIRSRWNYLKRCIFGQVNVDDKYFFHRDETYLWCLESRCFDECPFPNYDLSTYAFSADSSFDLVSAADHLAYLGKYLEMDRDVAQLKKLSERVRAKAEQTYWNPQAGYWAPAQSLLGPLYNAPFANILMNPFWCGYARNDLDPLGETPQTSKRAITAIQNAYPWLGRDDGFWKTTPTMDFFVGMNPGQLLYSLCKARSPWAEKAYRATLKTATPSGEFAEMYDGDYHPWNPPAWGVGTSGRVRPWEGGLDTESVLEYLTGFSPDAGNHRVVFAPHLPDELKGLTADRFVVGNAQVSLAMTRTGSKEWTLTLRQDKGQPLDVIVDFWASRRILANVAIIEPVSWDRTIVETQGKEARCRFTPELGKDYTFTVSEDALLPDDELNPPKPQVFTPPPYGVDDSDLLLVTTPSGIFNKHKHTPPDDFLSVARSELKLMQRISPSVAFLDMDLPVSPADIGQGLLDEKGQPRCKVAVFGRGAFSSGKHDFKPESFWTDPGLHQAFQKYLDGGGCILLGPSYPNREVLPDWLVSMTGGGWEEGIVPDKAVVASSARIQSNQKLLDEVDVANTVSESAHAVTFAGETFEDTQNLPDGLNERKMIKDDGRGFSAYYQFTVKTEPGVKHRLWLRVNTGRNMKGMALLVQQGEKWVQVGVRTQNDGATRHFEALYFDVPADRITSDQTVFRLISKTGDEVNTYHLWMYKVEGGANLSWTELLGFSPNHNVGEVSHGLIPHGKDWKMPVLLSQHPEQAALIVRKIGNGYLIRSELSLEDSVNTLKALIKDQTREQLKNALAGS